MPVRRSTLSTAALTLTRNALQKTCREFCPGTGSTHAQLSIAENREQDEKGRIRPAEASEDARSAGVESDREAQQVRTHQGSQDFTSLIAGLEGIAEREADDCDTAAKDAVMLRQEPGIAIVQLDTVIRPDQAGRKEQRQRAERLYHATCR